MKKTAALLLLIGLVSAYPVHSEEKTPGQPASAPTQSYVQKTKSSDDFVTLNFTNIDINALVKVMSELTRKNFILDERVTGKVTLMTPTKISPDEAYQVFLSALEIKGFTAVEDGRIIRIIPVGSARQSGLKVVQNGEGSGEGSGEGFVTKLIRLTYVNPQEVVRTLTPLISKDGSILPYPATNSIIVTDSVSNLRKIDSLVHAMDVAAPEGKGKINVYNLRHANAEDVAKLLTALVAKIPAPPPPGSAQPANPFAILESTVSVSADKATNALILIASPGDYEVVKDVIQKLDIRRRQVYVEAAIIEMSQAKQRELGFEFNYAPSEIQAGPGAPTTPLGGTNFGTIGNVVAGGPAGLAGMNGLTVGAIKGTFTYNGATFLNVGALLHALQIDGNVNVLSTPNILTTDNQKAEIMVGQNVPFLTGQTQNATTGSTALFNTIERKDVGIKLTITPQITSDDNVRLDVNQEISDVVASSLTNPAGLTTSKRSAITTVVVKDRQTMVIGGLISDNLTSSESKVPFLGDIPLLGWLFKTKSSKVEKTNLMIFITPYILKNEEEAMALTQRKGDLLDEFRKEYKIEKKGGEPDLRPVKPLGKNGTAEKPANESAQPQTEMKTAPDQAVGSAGTTTTPPVVSPATDQAVGSAGTTTTPSVVSPATDQSMGSAGTTTMPPVVAPPPDQTPGSFPTSTLPPVNTREPAEGVR